MRHARAYSRFAGCLGLCHPFCRSSRFCRQKSQRITKNPYCWGSRSFEVIYVDATKRHFISVCYDQQHVCAYLQAFSR